MPTVAVGWQLYTLTGSALDLGLLGLVQFVPTIALTLVGGPGADRHDRRVVVVVCQVAQAGASVALAVGSHGGWLGRGSVLAIVGVLGAAQAFANPSRTALLPRLVPLTQLGEFESGVLAALLGPVPAVVLGGVGTIVVAALWMYRFPELLRFHLTDS